MMVKVRIHFGVMDVLGNLMKAGPKQGLSCQMHRYTHTYADTEGQRHMDTERGRGINIHSIVYSMHMSIALYGV